MWCLYPEYLEERDIAGKLRLEIVFNSHFYNCSMDRSVVMATVKLGVVFFTLNIWKKELLVVS